MKPLTLIGIALLVLGGLALAYQGITYTRTKEVFALGPLHATTETHERIPLPPILGRGGIGFRRHPAGHQRETKNLSRLPLAGFRREAAQTRPTTFIVDREQPSGGGSASLP